MTSCSDLEDREEVGSSPGDREGAPQPTTLLLSLPKEWGKAQPRLGLHSPEMPQQRCGVPQPMHSLQRVKASVNTARDSDGGNSAGNGISLLIAIKSHPLKAVRGNGV